ncbi:MAG: hypothetical protein ACE15C_00245 [Phycisphaerae bacterium]
MRNMSNKRASALVMVIGMLTVLFMLGVTFLAVAHMNAKQADALASTSQYEPVSAGVLSYLRALIGAGRYADPVNGPYGAMPSGSTGWKQYICYPSEDVTPWLGGWLAENTRASAAGWPSASWTSGASYLVHASNFSGQMNLNYNDVRVAAPPFPMTPTDGNPMNLANGVWKDSGVTNARGERYWWACNVQDLSGLLNVNTACDGTLPPAGTTISPAYINLAGFLGAPYGNYLHAGVPMGRCVNYAGAAAPTVVTDFDRNCARRLLSPINPVNPPVDYRPFSIGDETCLRWLRSGNPSITGRLASCLWNTGVAPPTSYYGATNAYVDKLRVLTTYNSAPSIPRYPSQTFPSRFLISSSTCLDTQADRDRLYEQMIKIVDATAQVNQRYVAHFVANLWAHISNQDITQQSYAFRPSNEPPGQDWTVYGLTDQLVISEVYAYACPPLADGTGSGWACAVEVLNPTSVQLKVGAYKIGVNGNLIDFAGAGAPATMNPGDRVVFYTYGGSIPSGDGTTRNNNPTESDFGFGTGAGWCKIAQLDQFTQVSGARIQLVRAAGGTDVPVDSAVGAEVGFAPPALPLPAGGLEAGGDAKRDDFNACAYGRATVAAYKTALIGYATLKAHTLGSANYTTDSSADFTGYDPGFAIKPLHAVPDSVGGLLDIYFIGPSKGTPAGDMDFPHAVIKDDATGATNWAQDAEHARAKPNVRPTSITFVAGKEGWPQPNGGLYPDVPIGCFLGEFLSVMPPDNTRADEPVEPLRIYGQLNINTANDALRYLPYANTLPKPGGGTFDPRTIDANYSVTAANYIIAYRDKLSANAAKGVTKSYQNRNVQRFGGIPGLRAASDFCGYLTPGEVAIPLADYTMALWQMAGYNNDPTQVNYLAARDALYRSISNLVTVNSDVFAANIVVQLRDLNNLPRFTWNYLAVIDRSNITFTRSAADRKIVGMPSPLPEPAVLLFTRLY